jgi:hypothetical protein
MSLLKVQKSFISADKHQRLLKDQLSSQGEEDWTSSPFQVFTLTSFISIGVGDSAWRAGCPANNKFR